MDEITHEKIEMAIAIVIDEAAPCTPATLRMCEAGLFRYICEGSIAVVMEEDVMSQKVQNKSSHPSLS